MVTQADLLRFMRSRRDGYWELLATAGGDEESLQTTLHGLSADAIGSAASGAAISPTLVDHRVQALAALDPRHVRRLSRDWKPLTALRHALMDLETDFWTVAWCSSLRFLETIPDDYRALPSTAPRPLQQEITALCGIRQRIATWEELVRVTSDPSRSYSDFRRIDFLARAQVTAEDLVALLGSPSPTPAALERLRALSRASIDLNASARTFLESLLEERWFQKSSIRGQRGGLALLMEILLRIGMNEELLSRSIDQLQERIAAAEGPADEAVFAYLLAGTSWRCP